MNINRAPWVIFVVMLLMLLPVTMTVVQAQIEPPPIFAKVFAPDTIASGGTSTLTFTIDNSASALAASGLDFTDNLPAAVTVATPANASTTCTGGTITAVAGSGVITYTGGTVAAGASCTLQVDVTSSIAGTHINTTGDLTSSSGNSGTASDALTVNPPPPFLKVFAPDPIASGGTSTLTFTIDNSASTTAATGLDFTDNLPASVTVATPANASTTCTGGTLTATPGSGVITYSGGSVAAGASCTVQVDVTAASAGAFVNVTGDLTSSSGNSGTASDTLTVAGDLSITKQFTDDPVRAGQNVTLEFTITNGDGAQAASNIAFTDDLDAVIPGLVAVGLPIANMCGAGSQISGTSLISLTGGNLPAGGSCTFSITVQVPAGVAPGGYLNVTSIVSGNIGAVQVSGNSANDTLDIRRRGGGGNNNNDDDDDTPPPVITVFDPAISKIGVLMPGQVGGLGERVEWMITVTNPSPVTGDNVVVSDTFDDRLRIDDVQTTKGAVTITGQTVTVNIGSLQPGETVTIVVTTTTLQGGVLVSNTACVNGSNAAGERCATAQNVLASMPAQLPATGETPWWRTPLLLTMAAFGLLCIAGFMQAVRSIRHTRMPPG